MTSFEQKAGPKKKKRGKVQGSWNCASMAVGSGLPGELTRTSSITVGRTYARRDCRTSLKTAQGVRGFRRELRCFPGLEDFCPPECKDVARAVISFNRCHRRRLDVAGGDARSLPGNSGERRFLKPMSRCPTRMVPVCLYNVERVSMICDSASWAGFFCLEGSRCRRLTAAARRRRVRRKQVGDVTGRCPAM